MSGVAKKKLLFLLADAQDRTYYVEGGVVKKSSQPQWLPQNPNGWKDITLKFDTNQKYFSTLRSFSNAVKFVDGGQQIIADRMLNGAGTEEVIYLIILRNNPAKGLNYYELEYKSRLDCSKFNGDPRTGISMNTLQDDVFAMVQAKENEIYPIACNSSNPKAVRVLFDGTALQDKLNYQATQVNLSQLTGPWFALPLTFVNNEGDSSGVIFGDQQYDNFPDVDAYVHYSANNNCVVTDPNGLTVTIKGEYVFKVTNAGGGSRGFGIFLYTNLMPTAVSGHLPGITLYDITNPVILGQTVTVPIDVTITLAPNEKLFFLGAMTGVPSPVITPQAATLSIMFASENQPTVNYAVRPLDLVQDLVGQITNGKCTVQSNFLSRNNRKVALSGSSLRSFPDAVIMTSFWDFFKSYSSAYNLGITIRKGIMYIEPVEDIYNSKNELINLGDISEVGLTVAEEFTYTTAKVGYVKQTYNKRNGRYETNCTHNYKFPIYTVLNQLDLVSPYRADPFGMEFIRTDYPNLNSTDDKGDADVFTVMISDSVGQTDGNVSTAVVFNMETLILAAPIIKTPFSSSTVYNNHPTNTGIAQSFKIITVYVNGIADGTTISDADGNWSYDIQQTLQSVSLIFNGVYTISANAQTDPGNISGFSNIITIIINTTIQSAFLITSPSNNDTIYNNLPLISGIAPSGKVITIKLDGTSIATVVTNSSGYWKFQTIAAIADGAHAITASAPGLADAPALAVTVNKNVSSPLITNVAYGDILFDNQPTVKGVAIPGTVVSVYLDGGGGIITGGIAAPLGTVTADANGDWTFHITNVVDANGLTTDHVPDGQHVFSTTPLPVDVLASITGYRLMRGWNKGPVMDFDSIKLDDAYIPPGLDPATLPPTLGQFLHPETLYNYVETSPLQMLLAHGNLLNGFLGQQGGAQIIFNGAEINANLVTKKDGVIRNERQNINVSDLAQALYINYYLNFKTKVPNTFNNLMTGLENAGYITVNFKGLDIFLLPIGSMLMKPATDEAQTWKLLISGKTPLTTLLKLFAPGVTLNIGKNMIYFSDKNPLHKVKYNFTPAAGYHFADIYDDFQKHRFQRWVYNPDYAQPWQYGDIIVEQAITNGVGSAQYHMISITTGRIVDTFAFTPVIGSVVALPNVLQQVTINLTTAYPEDQYWLALYVDGQYVAIAEKIDLRSDWPDTLKIEYGGSVDQIDYYFSTGIMPMIRIQGELLLWKADSEVDNYEDENGDFEITRGVPLKVRDVQFGSERSLLSDWMALKANHVTLLTNCVIESYHYTRNNNSKMEQEDFGKGVPEIMAKMEIVLADNQLGMSFSTPGDSGVHTTAFTLDATAFGYNEGVLNVIANEV